ncbi:MAG TPA: FAD-dependent monooxygenase [Candidatus Acidoferrum sp.]|nr:FAD-dependent monooxygenase [Candidatus Acidoferrum sp.]
MSQPFDLVIVGGGLGGATLAKCMAERGARVLVLEHEKQFRDRVRGEFLTPWGVAEAMKLGIYDLLCEKVAHKIPWVDFFAAEQMTAHRDVVATTPHQCPCVSFYHPEMQELLLSAAERAGATVRRGTSFKEIKGRAPLIAVLAENGHTEEVHARLLVGVDGRSSVVRAAGGFQTRRDPENMLLAGLLWDGMSCSDDISQLIFNFALGQVSAVFPQKGGRVRTYLGYHVDTLPRFQGQADIPRFVEGCKKAGINAAYFHGAQPAGPLATFAGAHTWVEHPFKDGVALMGDAASASDPSWGQGLGSTLRDVRLLRDLLLSTEDWGAAGHAYAEQHDRHSEVTRTVNNWYAEFFLETGPRADERRARAFPLIDQDLTRQPDTLFSGPDIHPTEAMRRRFFAEDA